MDYSVPSYFICPISLQIMEDPVTISTGITFDRSSIQKWLFYYKHKTCPVTKQPLSDFSLIPNSNLLRLIQSWQSKSPLKSVDQTPENSNSSAPDFSLLVEDMKKPHLQLQTIKKIRTLISKKSLDASDDVIFSSVASAFPKSDDLATESSVIIGDTVDLLCLLKPSQESLKTVSESGNGNVINSICTIMTKYLQMQIRIQSAQLLNSIFEAVDGIYKEQLKPELFETMAEILKDQNSKTGTTAVLKILMQVLEFGKNKEKAIKGGTIQILVELLAENNESQRATEMMVAVLEKMCQKAEGRAVFLGHPMGVAAVSAVVFRVPSQYMGNYKAVKLLLQIVRYCKSDEVMVEFMEVGAVSKVLMVTQSCCDLKTKRMAMEILGFIKRNWRSSHCLVASSLST